MDLCVALCVEPVLEVEGEREEKKKDCWKAQENVMNHAKSEKKWQLERNNKERLKIIF